MSGKIVISGILAFVILSFGCLIYCNEPLHYSDPFKVTDFIREPHKFYSQACEGFGYGHTNNEGYNNIQDYHRGDSIDVLVVGTSHMEALQVVMDEATSYLLGQISGMRVYNIAVAGQSFALCLQSLKAAVKKYRPSKFIVIETGEPTLTDKQIADIISGRIKGGSRVNDPNYGSGIINFAAKSDFLRLIYHQHIKSRLQKSSGRGGGIESHDYALLSEMLRASCNTVKSCGAELIIAYHPSVSINNDGSLTITRPDSEYMKNFATLCRENGVHFLDIGGRFLKEYEEKHILPYGFANTSVGRGHMNRHGHRMFAEEIHSLMQRIEAES